MSTNNHGKPSPSFLRIASFKPPQLEELMLRGEMPDVNALVGREYRGMNITVVARFLGIRKFIKGFFLKDGRVFGYNVRAQQNAPDKHWFVKATDGESKRFGFYRVAPVDPESRDNAYLNALLLDYGQGGNNRFDITTPLRDYLVRVPPNFGGHPDSDDLLLGKAFMAIGPLRLPLGYFLLERRARWRKEEHI